MNKEEKILSRIKKLLAMAGDSASPNEAMIAAKRARKLMDDHQITKADLLTIDDSTFCETQGEVCPKRKETWMSILAWSAAHLNDCIAITAANSRGVAFRFQGFKADAIVAKHINDYLVSACIRLLEKSGISGRSNRNFYKMAFAKEIGTRVVAIVKERATTVTSTGKDLVVSKKELIQNHFGDLPSAREPKVRDPSGEELLAARKGAEDAAALGLDPQVGAEVAPARIQ